MNPNDSDIKIISTDDEKKTRFGWSKLVWGAVGIVAAIAIVFFLLPRLSADSTHSAATKTAEAAPSVPEDEAETVAPSKEENPSNDNDVYCAKIGSSQDKTDRLYCDSLLPEARKVDARLEKLENGGGSSIPAWLIVVVIALAASQVLTWTMLFKKRDKD